MKLFNKLERATGRYDDEKLAQREGMTDSRIVLANQKARPPKKDKGKEYKS